MFVFYRFDGIWAFFINFWQYIQIFHKESESEVNKCQILTPGREGKIGKTYVKSLFFTC